jgi:bromodomain-containing protein 7/9
MEGGAYRRTAVRKRGRGSSKIKVKGSRLGKTETDQLLGIIRNMMNHPLAGPFNAPVDPYEVPDYHTVIKKPMDFSTIKVNYFPIKHKHLYIESC